MITSPRAREAFDLSREPDEVREKYGAKEAKYIYGNDPTPTNPWPADKFLLARRLVEAGVSVVTMRVGDVGLPRKDVPAPATSSPACARSCRCWIGRSMPW